MLNIGEKYYKYIDDKLDIIRIHKILDDIIIISRGINKSKIDKEYINEYTKLNPDGYVFFNIVNMGKDVSHGQDVIVLLNRREDIKNNIKIPYVICRQNIFDAYSNQLNKTENVYLGMSANKDNIPEGIEFETMLACSGIEYTEKISIYIDDTLDIILDMISNMNKFNNVLYKIHKDLIDSPYSGTSKSLHSLLIDNHFIYDFKRAYNILPIDFKLEYINNELIPEHRMLLEDITKNEMFKTYVIPYSKTINLNKIKRNYILVSDKLEKLYIVAYDKGLYINRPYRNNIKDKRDHAMMVKNIINNKKQ